MKIKHIIIYCSILLVLFTSCATAPYKSKQKILDYYQSPPQSSSIYWGIGVGTDLVQATRNSQLDIARQMNIKLQEKTVYNVESSGDEIVDENISSTIEMDTEAILQKVKRLDYKQSDDGEFFVLSYLINEADYAVNEELILKDMQDAYNSKKTWKTVGTFFVPGMAQLVDGDVLKGSILLTGAIGGVTTAIIGVLGMDSNYRSYLSASNSSVQQYYYGQFENMQLLTICTGVAYAVCGLISAIDFQANSF